jgi:hypothetical protein
MSDDPQRRAPPNGPPLLASPPEPAAPPAAVMEVGATKAFTIKMETWLTDLAVDANAPVPVDETGAPLATYPLDPFVPPPRGPTPVPLPPAYDHEPDARSRESAPSVVTPPKVHYYPESLPVAPSPVGPSAPVASAVPPIPSLAAGEPRFDAPRTSGPPVLPLLVAAVVVLVGAGVASWLLWGERIRALLKI